MRIQGLKKQRLVIAISIISIISLSSFLSLVIHAKRKDFSWIENNEYFQFDFAKGIAYFGDFSVNGLSEQKHMDDIQEMTGNGSDFISLTTFWYQDYLNSTVIYNTSSTHNLTSVGNYIDDLHGINTKVQFKPMLDVRTGEWRSWIIPSEAWWVSWHNWTLMMAELAYNHSVEIFCVGCEMGNTEGNVTQWRNLIHEIRQKYPTLKLTYAANWDAYFRIEWWDELDFIGLDAWFPLTTKLDPTVDELRNSWNGIAQYLEQVSKQWNRPILFTEMGYQSRDGCNIMPWDVKFRLVLDYQEQADCYEAFLTSNVYTAPWFAGCFWWAWHPEEQFWQNDTSDPTSWIFNHSPNGKLAGDVINEYYHKPRIEATDLSYWNYIGLTWTLTCIPLVSLVMIYLKKRGGAER
ncbi:MAG: hypothetical protein ACFFCS_20195 [Candidatus Hodarchaeota archaeon]